MLHLETIKRKAHFIRSILALIYPNVSSFSTDSNESEKDWNHFSLCPSLFWKLLAIRTEFQPKAKLDE